MHLFEGEHAVFCHLADFYAELVLDNVEDALAAFNEAGGPHADGDGVTAFWLHREEGIECDDAIDFRSRYACFFSYIDLQFLWQITE